MTTSDDTAKATSGAENAYWTWLTSNIGAGGGALRTACGSIKEGPIHYVGVTDHVCKIDVRERVGFGFEAFVLHM